MLLVPGLSLMGSLLIIYSRVRLQWGYMIHKPGTTAAKPAYVLPPPTTVVGAFAWSLAHVAGIPRRPASKHSLGVLDEFHDCALRATRAAAAGLAPFTWKGPSRGVGAVVYEELSRILGAPFKNYKSGSFQSTLRGGAAYALLAKPETLPVQGVGAAYAPGALIDMAWLVDVKALSECWKNHASSSSRGSELHSLLRKASHGVFRIGSREGLAAPVNSGVYSVEFRARSWSTLPQPAECVHVRAGNAVAVSMLSVSRYPEQGSLVEEEFLVPTRGGGPGLLLPPSCSSEQECGVLFEAVNNEERRCRIAVPLGGLPWIGLAVRTGSG